MSVCVWVFSSSSSSFVRPKNALRYDLFHGFVLRLNVFDSFSADHGGTLSSPRWSELLVSIVNTNDNESLNASEVTLLLVVPQKI